MAIDYYTDTSEDTLDPAEFELYTLIMDYRDSLGLPDIPLSQGLTVVAGRHVLDTIYNFGEYAGHSWSDAPFEPGDSDTFPAMWEAPERIGTGYSDYGFEISAGWTVNNDITTSTMTPERALELWQDSPPHDDVITSTDPWTEPWNAIGVGLHQGSAHVWFGRAADPNDGPAIVGAEGAVAETMNGTRFVDELRSLAGDDTVRGLGGADEVYGNQGNDLIKGGAGADTLFGGQNGGDPTADVNGLMRKQDGTETVDGGAGDDLVYGNFGADILYGGPGDDVLFGGQGSDTLDGGPGDDTLWGNREPDVLSGGDGADVFYLNGAGADRITDFDPGAGDRLAAIGGFANPRANDHDDGMVFSYNDGGGPNHTILEGLDAADYSADWLL